MKRRELLKFIGAAALLPVAGIAYSKSYESDDERLERLLAVPYPTVSDQTFEITRPINLPNGTHIHHCKIKFSKRGRFIGDGNSTIECCLLTYHV